MPSFGSDRNLLFGILALQMDFITRDALVAAMNAWVSTRPGRSARSWSSRGARPTHVATLLEALVHEHLEAARQRPGAEPGGGQFDRLACARTC